MMIQILHNNRCSKSRCALQYLENEHIAHQVIPYLENPLNKEELRELINKLGITPEALVRKNEAVYKEHYQDKTFSDEEWISILTENPILIERPIVIKGNKAVIGRPLETVVELLKA
ncbi:arsenate reductase (glutaredoxin) (plasmid) [Pedobacter sp. BS3]|nr:arsenate reductase (glutaredoxin) [Pedobacter sp. BS3]